MELSEVKNQFPDAHKAIEYLSEKMSLSTASTKNISWKEMGSLNIVILRLGTRTLGEVLGVDAVSNVADVLAWKEFVVARTGKTNLSLLIKHLGHHGKLASACVSKIYRATQEGV